MKLKGVNIQHKLSIEKRKGGFTEKVLLQQVRAILEQDETARETIASTLRNGPQNEQNVFCLDFLETESIFHLDQIKKTCIDYRMRFLDSKYFKGEIPAEAVTKIKHLELQHKIAIKGYKVMAPSRHFKLADKDDPLLFAPIGNGYYYLVHQWGTDLHPLRKILMWPFKSIVNLGLVVFVATYFLTLLVPDGLFSKSNSGVEFWIIYFFMFKSLAAVVIFYGFALGKNFSPAIWNSKYFNA